MSENYTYHYKKELNYSKEKIYKIIFNKIISEFPKYNQEKNPFPSRRSELVGYNNKSEYYEIKLEDYNKDDFIIITSQTGINKYITRYEFHDINENMCEIHILEKMESTSKRVSMNYSFMSFFIKLGKKNRWNQFIKWIETELSYC